MKTLSSIIVLILLVSTVFAGDDALGEPLTLTEITKVSDILGSPDSYIGKTVRIEGAIVDVCAKRGCWMDIASDKEFEQITVKVEDGEIVFPMTAKGHNAIVEGVVEKLHWTKEEMLEIRKQQAEEQGEEFDPNDPTIEERSIYRLKGLGAIIKN
ncbi:MAG: DUF4920 domain-containing protein [Candidatus Marinimicrobia bacterium]|nr:DUF4920 domain-containing protein [Candidatus Neomarinimicrobiota bacterium]